MIELRDIRSADHSGRSSIPLGGEQHAGSHRDGGGGAGPLLTSSVLSELRLDGLPADRLTEDRGAGCNLNSPALVADGNHARTDGFVSLAVVASALTVALGLDVGDPIIGLAITVVILRITWQSFQTVRSDPGEHDDHPHDLQQPERARGDTVATGDAEH